MAKLTDAQNIILVAAYNNGEIVPSSITKTLTNKSALTRNIKALMKAGLLVTSAGIKGVATESDYGFELDKEHPLRRLFMTTAAHNHLDGEDRPEEIIEAAEEEIEAQDFAEVSVNVAFEALEEDMEDMDDGEDVPASVVKEGYKRRYRELQAQGGSGQGCNDAIDKWMQSEFNNVAGRGKRYRLNVDQMFAFAIENGVDVNKWILVNNGMKRMNVAKAIRHRLNSGHDVTHNGKRIFKGVSQKRAA